MSTGRLRGTVKNIQRDKGFAFIKREDGERDVFLHRSVFNDRPRSWDEMGEDQPVEFAIEDGPKGPRATSVSLL